MSILGKAKAMLKIKTGEPLAAIVKAELDTAERELRDLELLRGELALAVTLGEPDAGAEMAAYRAKVDEGRRRVSDLQSAYSAARERDAAAERERIAAARRSQVEALKAQLRRREKAAVELSAAIENACAAFAEVIAINEKIAALLPGGALVGGGGLVGFPGLKAAVAEELMRLGHGPAGPGNIGIWPRAFPGGAVADLRMSGNPEALTPLDARVKSSGSYLLGLMAGDAPKPVAAASVPTKPVGETVGEPESEGDPSADLEAATLATGPKMDARHYTPPRQKLN